MRASSRRSAIAIVLFAVATAQTPRLARAHGNHGAASGGMGHSGAGIATVKSDPSLKLAVDLFSYLGLSAASEWRSGEPLGAGGKIPLYYNQVLYREAPYERQNLAKKDYWPQYRDFSYVPLWQPAQIGVRTQYRFLPELQGTVSVTYFGSVDKPTAEPNALEVQEMFVRWSPERLPGFALSFGHLFLVGTYSPGFDQFPLEIHQFDGLALEYERPIAAHELRLRGAAGRAPVGRTTAVEPIDPEPLFNHPFMDGLRERTHLYATTGLQLANGLYLGALGGYQVMPEDQATSNDRAPSLVTKWPRASGWQAGLEAGFVGRRFEHHLVASYGRGDVEMGWGTPDFVLIDDAWAERAVLSRAGSQLLQAVYWGAFAASRFAVSGGVWGQWRIPTPQERAWNIWVENVMQTVVARTEPFRAIKLNLVPRYTVGLLSFGVRFDGIRYLDKRATTNTVEPQTDEALRPIHVKDAAGNIVDRAQAPSKWEREAVDCAIFSPFVELTVGGIFALRAAWSGAVYSAEVHRQRRDSNFHSNLTLSAWLVYRFGVPGDEMKRKPPSLQ